MNVPELRFPEFEGEWEERQLAEITDKKISYGIVQAGPHVPDGMPYIKSKDLNGPLTLSELERTSDAIARSYRRSEVRPGDIVFSLRGNIGVSQIVPDTISIANLTQGTARISVNKFAVNKFVYRALETRKIRKRIFAVMKGSTFQEISLGDLRQIGLAAPSIPEQKKIATFLGVVDAKLAALRDQQAGLERYKRGLMQSLFSQSLRFTRSDGTAFPDWEEKRLGEVTKKTASSVTAQSLETDVGEYPVYGASGYLKSISTYASDVEHISIVKDGAGVGRLLLCPSLSSVLGTLDSIVATGINNTRFVYYWLSLINFEPFVTGSTIPHIYFKDYSKLLLFLPHPDEQQKITEALSAMDAKIAAVAEQVGQMEQFKKGLLQQMFV